MNISKIKTEVIKVKLTFTEEILGGHPANKSIYSQFVASKAPDAKTMEEEVAERGADEVLEDKMTIFERDEDDRPFLYDYMVKGFFKSACSALSRCAVKVNGKKSAVNASSGLTAFKKIIDGNIFIEPRKLFFENADTIGQCERPLRANTPQGERVALACSESIPAGSSITFDIHLLSSEHKAAVLEWLEYGVFNGIGQWRNSGKGRFTYEILDADKTSEQAS